jgi:hypothetical protein
MDTKITTSDKISIINSLLSQDRAELLDIKKTIYNFTYITMIAYFSIIAYIFSTKSDQLHLNIIRVGSLILFGFYLIIYFYQRYHFNYVRRAQDIRESFYKHIDKLYESNFTPLRDVNFSKKPLVKYNFIKAYLFVTIILFLVSQVLCFVLQDNFR